MDQQALELSEFLVQRITTVRMGGTEECPVLSECIPFGHSMRMLVGLISAANRSADGADLRLEIQAEA